MYELRVERKNDNKIILIEAAQFENKKEADKEKREMIKRYKMIRHAGHIVNYRDHKELYTNY